MGINTNYSGFRASQPVSVKVAYIPTQDYKNLSTEKLYELAVKGDQTAIINLGIRGQKDQKALECLSNIAKNKTLPFETRKYAIDALKSVAKSPDSDSLRSDEAMETLINLADADYLSDIPKIIDEAIDALLIIAYTSKENPSKSGKMALNGLVEALKDPVKLKLIQNSILTKGDNKAAYAYAYFIVSTGNSDLEDNASNNQEMKNMNVLQYIDDFRTKGYSYTSSKN